MKSKDTIGYYERAKQLLGSDIAVSLRLFMVPGMGHCAGGPGATFDAVGAIDQWVIGVKVPDGLGDFDAVELEARESGTGGGRFRQSGPWCTQYSSQENREFAVCHDQPSFSRSKCERGADPALRSSAQAQIT